METVKVFDIEVLEPEASTAVTVTVDCPMFIPSGNTKSILFPFSVAVHTFVAEEVIVKVKVSPSGSENLDLKFST
jgi:hypothetical protein